jgi:DNA modification methylase
MAGDAELAPDKTNGRKRANELDGATWTRYSISVWNDIKKTSEEIAFRHPAMFPIALPMRLIECFTKDDEKVVLDPFAGVGSTAVAAEAMGKTGIAIELSEDFVQKARQRPALLTDKPGGARTVQTGDARQLEKFVASESVDLVITSPPYWDILLQKRTADYREQRDYGSDKDDLGKIRSYSSFLYALQQVFRKVYDAMRPGKYCCVVVMDIRKKDKFYCFHADLANYLGQIGFELDDIIIWDRRQEYSNLRPLGFPSRFRINKIHEFIMIFRKPQRPLTPA